jgi:alpha-tubulin suppressor-like RCC1 family protein
VKRSLTKGILLTALVLSMTGASASAATPSVRVALDYACALADTGTVSCWGRNYRGQLGNGTFTDSATPVPVSNVSNVAQLDIGMYGACALIVDGTVKCWGSNAYGQLGTGGGSSVNAQAVTVAGIADATKISVGEATICAIVAGGTVKCWGYGSSGQLGIAVPPSSTATPVSVGLGGPATDIAVADFHACAVVGAGLKCWGDNSSKEIANPGMPIFHTPVAVAGLASGVALAAPGIDHTCVIMLTGAIKCWGANGQGQDGTGLYGGTVSPQDSLITSGATSIGYGDNHLCALVGDSAKCWGAGYYGQLGTGTLTGSAIPITPAFLASGVTSIDAGGDNACAIVSKVVKCWGPTGGGALGNGSSVHHNTAVDVSGLGVASAVDVGGKHTCAVVSAAVKCWGSGSAAQLGNFSSNGSITPIEATAFAGAGTAGSVMAMQDVTCGIFTGAVKCLGNGGSGQLANNTTNSSSAPVSAQVVTANTAHVDGSLQTLCSTASTGANQSKILCWGENQNSLLGQGSGQNYATLNQLNVPTEVVGIAAVSTDVAVHQTHACAVVTGSLRCWGRDDFGEVTGTSTHGEIPVVQTPIASGIQTTAGRKVAVGYSTTCAIVTSPAGGVKCFGRGDLGALGTGSFASSADELAVTGVTGATSLAASDNAFCAVISGGSVKCWGLNFSGELGNGTNKTSNLPVTVQGISDASAISGQGDSFCALRSGGGVKCWGDGGVGQLGDGTALYATTPGDVIGLSLFTPSMPSPLPTYVKQKIKATLKLNGKIKQSGKKKISVPLKLYFAAPPGSNTATVCLGNTTISVKTSKKTTTKLKVKFKPVGANCSYTGKIKLPKTFKGKKTKFTVSVPTNADVLAYKSAKTLKLK